jgi:hypothetical protein
MEFYNTKSFSAFTILVFCLRRSCPGGGLGCCSPRDCAGRDRMSAKKFTGKGKGNIEIIKIYKVSFERWAP